MADLACMVTSEAIKLKPLCRLLIFRKTLILNITSKKIDEVCRALFIMINILTSSGINQYLRFLGQLQCSNQIFSTRIFFQIGEKWLCKLVFFLVGEKWLLGKSSQKRVSGVSLIHTINLIIFTSLESIDHLPPIHFRCAVQSAEPFKVQLF